MSRSKDLAAHVGEHVRGIEHVHAAKFMLGGWRQIEKLAGNFAAGKDKHPHLRKREAFEAELKKASDTLLLRQYKYFRPVPVPVYNSPLVLWPVLTIGAGLIGLKDAEGCGDTDKLTDETLVRISAGIGHFAMKFQREWVLQSTSNADKAARRSAALWWLTNQRGSWTPIDVWGRMPSPQGCTWETTAQNWEAILLRRLAGMTVADAYATATADYATTDGAPHRAMRRVRAVLPSWQK